MNFSQKQIVNFWKKVDKKGEDECWNWKKTLDIYGYGQYNLNNKNKKAHQVSLFLAHAVQPLNKPLTLHTCKENRKCCNPNHLYYGDRKDNGKDTVKDGTLKGERNGGCKLTEVQVREIRQKYIPREYTLAKLAEEYKVSMGHIGSIIDNKRWKHVK